MCVAGGVSQAADLSYTYQCLQLRTVYGKLYQCAVSYLGIKETKHQP